MERAVPAALLDFTQEIDRALRKVEAADADQAGETAERLVDQLPALEGWAEEVRSSGEIHPDAAAALRQLQIRTFRLAKVIRHLQWVRQGLSDIAIAAAAGYERDGQYRRSEPARIVAEG